MHALALLAVVHADTSACGASVAPSPAVAFVLQVSAVGAAIGSLVAWRAQRRDADANVWVICTAWTLLGLVVGVLVLIARVLVAVV